MPERRDTPSTPTGTAIELAGIWQITTAASSMVRDVDECVVMVAASGPTESVALDRLNEVTEPTVLHRSSGAVHGKSPQGASLIQHIAALLADANHPGSAEVTAVMLATLSEMQHLHEHLRWLQNATRSEHLRTSLRTAERAIRRSRNEILDVFTSDLRYLASEMDPDGEPEY